MNLPAIVTLFVTGLIDEGPLQYKSKQQLYMKTNANIHLHRIHIYHLIKRRHHYKTV